MIDTPEGVKVGSAYIEVNLKLPNTNALSNLNSNVQKQLDDITKVKSSLNNIKVKDIEVIKQKEFKKAQGILRGLSRDVKGLGNDIADLAKIPLAPITASLAAFKLGGNKDLESWKQYSFYINKLKESFINLGEKMTKISMFGRTINEWLNTFANLINNINVQQLEKLFNLSAKAFIFGKSLAVIGMAMRTLKEIRGMGGEFGELGKSLFGNIKGQAIGQTLGTSIAQGMSPILSTAIGSAIGSGAGPAIKNTIGKTISDIIAKGSAPDNIVKKNSIDNKLRAGNKFTSYKDKETGGLIFDRTRDQVLSQGGKLSREKTQKNIDLRMNDVIDTSIKRPKIPKVPILPPLVVPKVNLNPISTFFNTISNIKLPKINTSIFSSIASFFSDIKLPKVNNPKISNIEKIALPIVDLPKVKIPKWTKQISLPPLTMPKVNLNPLSNFFNTISNIKLPKIELGILAKIPAAITLISSFIGGAIAFGAGLKILQGAFEGIGLVIKDIAPRLYKGLSEFGSQSLMYIDTAGNILKELTKSLFSLGKSGNPLENILKTFDDKYVKEGNKGNAELASPLDIERVKLELKTKGLLDTLSKTMENLDKTAIAYFSGKNNKDMISNHIVVLEKYFYDLNEKLQNADNILKQNDITKKQGKEGLSDYGLDTINKLKIDLQKKIEETNTEVTTLYSDLYKIEIDALKEKIQYAEAVKGLSEKSSKLIEDINMSTIDRDKNIEGKQPKQEMGKLSLTDIPTEFLSGVQKYQEQKKDVATIMEDYTKQQLAFEKEKQKIDQERLKMEQEKKLKELEKEGKTQDVLTELKKLIKLIMEPPQ